MIGAHRDVHANAIEAWKVETTAARDRGPKLYANFPIIERAPNAANAVA